MPSISSAGQRSGVGEAAGDICPWCGQPVSHEKFEEILARIEREARVQAEAIAKEAAAQVAKTKSEAAVVLERAKTNAQLQVVAARVEGKREAAAEATVKVSEAEKATAVAEKALAAEKDRHEKAVIARLREQRDALEKDKQKAVRAEQAAAFADRQKLEEKLQSLQRQLRKKTADELGEGAEVDLYDELKAAFPSDQITRVKRGENGADIVHAIIERKRQCGIIVYDSKNRTAWRNDYVTKLRKDQLAAKADHAVFACHVFPAGARQIHVRDGVILANPARVMVLVEILRSQVVQLATVRLSLQERAKKVDQLYEFITSEPCIHRFEQIESLADAILELDVREKKAHDATWKQRGELIRSLQQAHGDLVSEIDSIIAAPARLREAT